LDDLAEYLVEIGFDMQELWRTLAATRAYQLSSQPADSEQSPSEVFASMSVKPLTPEQLYDSLSQAAPSVSGPVNETNARAGISATSMVLDAERTEFIRRMRSPSDETGEFSSGILQTLMLINGETMDERTAPERSGLVGAVEAPFLTDQERLDAMFLATLSRFPSTQEYRTCLEYLTSERPDVVRKEALSDILWSILNSTEFAFNH
jgi:hypothetical protein